MNEGRASISCHIICTRVEDPSSKEVLAIDTSLFEDKALEILHDSNQF